MRKPKSEMLEDILFRLRTEGGITATTPGSIARLFAEVIVEEFDPLYDELDLMMSMAFVSSATNSYLDLIGELLNCPRNEDESDDDYRARIINQVSVIQTANLTSLRLKALQVSGVADVQFKRYTHGAGSFTCYIIPEVYPVPNDLLLRVEEALHEVVAYGMAYEVKISDYIPVDMDIQLIFRSNSTTLERQHIRNQVSGRVTSYIGELKMGDTIVINEIIQRVMEASEQVLDMKINRILVNEKEYYIKNIEPSAEEQYYLRKISVT